MRGWYGHKVDQNCPWCHERFCDELTDKNYWPCEHGDCICPIAEEGNETCNGCLNHERKL